MTGIEYPVDIDGATYYAQNSGVADAIVNEPNGETQFTVSAGDVWSGDPSTVNRSEAYSRTQYSDGTGINASYTVAVQSGISTDPKSWVALGQFHQNDGPNTPSNAPPFAVSLVGGKMTISIGYTGADGKDTSRTIWTDSSVITEGAQYTIDINVTFDSSGNGDLSVSRNGATLVTYLGPLGYDSQSSVLLQRGHLSLRFRHTTMVADYSNTSVSKSTSAISTAGSAASSLGAALPAGYTLESSTSDYDSKNRRHYQLGRVLRQHERDHAVGAAVQRGWGRSSTLRPSRPTGLR